ncbi:MAG: PepSY-associated TM helix domain-containing protein [Noviherbaspirillum sp.]
MSFRAWYEVHKWTSLVSTVFLLMLCITGLPLIFSHEIDHALGKSVEPPALHAQAHRQADIDAIVADAQRRRPQDVLQFLVTEPDDPNVLFVRMADKITSSGLTAFYTYDLRSGEFLNAYPLGEGFMDVMLRLHVDMYAGLPGTLFLGFMGLLLVASLVSGVVVYGPYMKKLPFGTVRRERVARIKWLDQHNLLGIVTLVWFFVVGLTGVINTLNIPLFGQWQATELADLARPFQGKPPLQGPVSSAAAVKAAQRAEPDMALSFMAYPGNNFSTPHHFMAFMRGSSPVSARLLKIVMIDAATSEVVTTREMPWYVSALMLSQPLHFGDYGGIGLKIVWLLLDLLTIIVLATGLVLWWKKRHVTAEQRLRMLATLERARRATP